MQKNFIDEKVFKNIEHEVWKHDIHNYAEWYKRPLLEDWETIRLQWDFTSYLLFLLIFLISSVAVLSLYISQNFLNSTGAALIFAAISLTAILIFLSYWLWNLLKYRKKWKRRVKFLRIEINKIK